VNQQIVELSPMWVLAGLSAGWLAETVMYRRGYGLIVDLGLGVDASVAGATILLALVGLPAQMFIMFVVGFVLAAGVIVVQRLLWPCEADAGERKARLRIAELGHPSHGGSGLAADAGGGAARATPSRALARLATTGIYLLRGVPIEVQRTARIRAAREETNLREVLLKGLGEYAAGIWTPQADARQPAAQNPRVRATSK